MGRSLNSVERRAEFVARKLEGDPKDAGSSMSGLNRDQYLFLQDLLQKTSPSSPDYTETIDKIFLILGNRYFQVESGSRASRKVGVGDLENEDSSPIETKEAKEEEEVENSFLSGGSHACHLIPHYIVPILSTEYFHEMDSDAMINLWSFVDGIANTAVLPTKQNTKHSRLERRIRANVDSGEDEYPLEKQHVKRIGKMLERVEYGLQKWEEREGGWQREKRRLDLALWEVEEEEDVADLRAWMEAMVLAENGGKQEEEEEKEKEDLSVRRGREKRGENRCLSPENAHRLLRYLAKAQLDDSSVLHTFCEDREGNRLLEGRHPLFVEVLGAVEREVAEEEAMRRAGCCFCCFWLVRKVKKLFRR